MWLLVHGTTVTVTITNGHLLFVMGALILQRAQKCEVRQMTIINGYLLDLWFEKRVLQESSSKV